MGIVNIFITTVSRSAGIQSTRDLGNIQGPSGKIAITPPKHLVSTARRKYFPSSDIPSREELKKVSKNPNLRCLQCGWKYNFKEISICPICSSDRSYLLANGSFVHVFLLGVLALTTTGVILTVIYRSIN
jgi:hypothetical protein